MSNALKDTFEPILTIGNETGLEVYYRAGITPWFHLTPDLQVTNPATGAHSDSAVILGLRAKITL